MSERPTPVDEPEDRLGMTQEQWQRFHAYTHGFGEQDENGVDISLLRENLKLTPEERLRKMFRGSPFAWQSDATREPPTCHQLLATLLDDDVRFVLIGEWAMWLHGWSSLTQDIDLLYERDEVNLERLARALKPLHPRLRGLATDLPFTWQVATLRLGLNFGLATDLGSLDLVGAAPGVDSFAGVWDRSDTLEVVGLAVRVASVDDLISMKRAAGRVKDQSHVSALERLRARKRRSKQSPSTAFTSPSTRSSPGS